MTPEQVKQKAPAGATHYDIKGGNPVYYMVNNLGFTMRYDGAWIVAIGLNINNFHRL